MSLDLDCMPGHSARFIDNIDDQCMYTNFPPLYLTSLYLVAAMAIINDHGRSLATGSQHLSGTGSN